jgi:hypothetical protein
MTKRMLSIAILLMMALTACAGDLTNRARGDVTIEAPVSGSIIYGETLTTEGSATNTPDNQFLLELRDLNDETLTRKTVSVEDGRWSVEIIHGYTGEPSEFTLIAQPVPSTAQENNTDENSDDSYAIQTLVISDLSYRPEGVYGTIGSLADGTSIGGDSIGIYGNLSGVALEDAQLLLIIDNDVVQQTTLTGAQASLVDDIVWESELMLGDASGDAEIRLVYGEDATVLASVDIRISTSAG